MLELVEPKPARQPRLASDWRPLPRRLCSPPGLRSLCLTAGLGGEQVRDLPSLRGFLQRYQARVLAPLELPAIHGAFVHASRFEVRELIALDRRLANEPGLREFAAASRAAGCSRLWRLRPLRDQRLVSRYWQAIELGQAHGWHTVVYGVVLAVFSIPLRQGLLNYGWQTLDGFVRAAARPLKLAAGDCEQLLIESIPGLRAAVETAVNGSAPAGLLIC
jgi:urease accessory protein UreF